MVDQDSLRQIDEWDNLYQDSEVQTLWGEMPAAYVVEKVVPLLRSHGSSDLLIVPCGEGRHLNVLRQLGRRIVAGDASRTVVEQLQRSTTMARYGDVSIVTSNIYDLQFPDNTFDAVLCWDLLSHLESPLLALENLSRILRGGGLAICNFYSVEDPDATQSKAKDYKRVSDQGLLYRYYSESSAVELFSKESWSVSVVETIRWWEDPHPGYRNERHMHCAVACIAEKRKSKPSY